MKNKVMISQPMRGKTLDQIKKDRVLIEAELIKRGFEVLNTVHEEYPKEIAEKDICVPIWYLSKSIEYMSQVDIVVFMCGWEHARGCKIEHTIAEEYGLGIRYTSINGINNEVSIITKEVE